MLEALDFYRSLGALPRACLLFPLGLVVGSFSTMLSHRLRSRQSIVRPRSHCPACGHTLGPAELVPLLSYLWLQGRCRYCRIRIPGRYLLLEAVGGICAAGAGAVGGWADGFAVAVLFPILVGLESGVRGRKRQSHAGFTLIEVLVALGLITALFVPVMNNLSVVRNAAVSGERRTQQVALARARLSQISNDAFSLGSGSPIAPVCNNDAGSLTGQDVLNDPALAIYNVVTTTISAGSGTCVMQVSVSCPICRSTSGQATPAYTTQSVIRKRTNGGG